MFKVIVVYLHLFLPQVHYTEVQPRYASPICHEHRQVACKYQLVFEEFKHSNVSHTLIYTARVKSKSSKECWAPPSAVYKVKIKREAYLVIFKPIVKTYNSYYCR